jgi:purine-cytosine permease-like protein
MAMPISWLPLIGDYSKKSKNTMQAAICPFLGYFVGSVLMYFLGLILALHSGKDIFAFIAGSQLRIPAMVIVILSTLTSAFLDLNSAAVSCQELTGIKKEKSLILLIGLVAALLSALFPSSSYFDYLTSLLLLIGMVFVPVYAAIFIDYLFKYPQRKTFFPVQTMVPVLCGLVAHYLSSLYTFWLPPSLLSMLVVLFCYLLIRVLSPARQKEGDSSKADCHKPFLTGTHTL